MWLLFVLCRPGFVAAGVSCAVVLIQDQLFVLQGVAINFVKSDDIRILRDIEQYYSTQVDEMVSASESLVVF